MSGRVLPGPMTVAEAYAIACHEVKACVREGDAPGDVRSNLVWVNHSDRGLVADAARALQAIYDRHHMSGDGSAGKVSGDALRAIGIDPDAGEVFDAR